MNIIFSDYFKYKAQLRGFKLDTLEDILHYSPERYFDTMTHRIIAVGKHDTRLVMIPYEQQNDALSPVTVHAVTRQQITYRLKTGRFTIYE
ncbi:MAG: hypothetical protein GY797_20575 [Deltaproteobacteria bacterium]|nr:hypothetical protein [Deltaproteobacteria bacterium]